MGWFKKTLGRLFGKKTEEVAVTTTETDSSANDEYVYEAGELTTYDCIVKAKELGLDMLAIDNKLNSMSNKKFVEWFKTEHIK
jgi:hypothetical protein